MSKVILDHSNFRWINTYVGMYAICSFPLSIQFRGETRQVQVCSYTRGITKPHWILPIIDRRSGNGHYQVKLYRGDGSKEYPSIHRLVLETFQSPCPPGLEACHNDGNPANNHINNLRWDTSQANSFDSAQHRILRGESSSKYVGVSWEKPRNKWRAQIFINGKHKHLGYFDTEEDAAIAYDQTVRKYFQPIADKHNLIAPTNKNRRLLP